MLDGNLLGLVFTNSMQNVIQLFPNFHFWRGYMEDAALKVNLVLEWDGKLTNMQL